MPPGNISKIFRLYEYVDKLFFMNSKESQLFALQNRLRSIAVINTGNFKIPNCTAGSLDTSL